MTAEAWPVVSDRHRREHRPHTRLLLLGLTGGVLLTAIAATVGSRWMEREGDRYFATGSGIVATLDDLARAFRHGDMQAMADAYEQSFEGAPLGLGALTLVATRDGVRQYSMNGASQRIDRRHAIADWAAYRASFKGIDEASLHLDAMTEWDGRDGPEGIVRLEVIGTPLDGARPAVDRARLRVGFRITSRNGTVHLTIRSAALIAGERVTSDRAQFTEVGHAAGIDFVNRHYPGFDQPLKFGLIRHGPGGITAVDYDNDGWYDLFIPDGVESRLFRNRGDGTFEDVTARAGLSGLDGVNVALFADYDNDGYKDLFVSRTFSHNQLFHNNRDGTFTDVTARSGIGADCCTTVASWGDYDNDGNLDLYVGRYVDPRTTSPVMFYSRNGEPNQLYHNNGDGTFTNVTARAGVGDRGLCLGTVWGDYDDDGYPDLFVANDFGRNTLYHNNRDGTFTDVTVKAGTLAYGAGMSANFGDYDNDGRLDIYVTHVASDFKWLASAPTLAQYGVVSWRQGTWRSEMPSFLDIVHQSGLSLLSVFRQIMEGNNLLRNRGDGTFEDVTKVAAANPPGWFWGAAFADFDNDGWLDLYAADGWIAQDRDTELELDFFHRTLTDHVAFQSGSMFEQRYFGRRSWHGYERNRHLRNNGDGTFLEMATAAGTDLALNSRGVAVADFWNRGALDIAVAASDDRHALLRNEIGPTRHWLGVELTGTRSNRDAVGARVTISARGRRQIREVTLGDGYASQSSLRQYFGLGAVDLVDELAVRWPRTGSVQHFRGVKADRIVAITEGVDALSTRHYLASKERSTYAMTTSPF